MSIWERQREDQLLFAYWKAINRALPNFSDNTIIEGFLNDFGSYCDHCTKEALRRRLRRMREEYNKEDKG